MNMALLSTWSRRKREAEKAASGVADVYHYHAPSAGLRERVRQVIAEAVEKFHYVSSVEIYGDVVSVIRKEIGKSALANGFIPNKASEFDAYILGEQDVDNWLTAVEIIDNMVAYYAERENRPEISREFTAELNAWMLEDEFGFQIQNHKFVQINSQFAHSEVIIPALQLLSERRFAGANSEFRQAHAEFRAGEYEDCIHDCCNAFESVLKVILDEKGWTYQASDPAKKLLDVVFSKNLIPSYMQTSFTGLRTILESGVPTVRNKNAGHGTGANPRNIPAYIAAFQLHQTAAAILLLAEAAK